MRKTFPTFESLIKHYVKHKDFKLKIDSKKHEESHKDASGNYCCERCEYRDPDLILGILHSCHNTPEILEGVRMHENKFFQLAQEYCDKLKTHVKGEIHEKPQIINTESNINLNERPSDPQNIEERSSPIMKSSPPDNDNEINNKKLRS